MAVRTMRPVGKFASARSNGVGLNRKDLRSVREVTLENHSAEYLYLRENELTEFDTDVTMKHLKVLDLSINDIGGTVDFLSKTPFLRHLYMTGNKIESLRGISNLSSLETLCLSDNMINSFEGLERLPNLRVLSLNFNSISSFEHYRNFPSLHTLNLVGNPLTEIPSYRSMAIAINNPNLVSIDGTPVQGEERAAVEHYQGKVVNCICDGFVVEGENVEEAADAFLLKLQRVKEKSKCLQLCSIRIHPKDETQNVLVEGSPVQLSCCLQDIRMYEQRNTDSFHSQYLAPVVFRVTGGATEAFVVGSMNNWADPIELERCEGDDEICFQTTLYLPPGSYEYRYILDGTEVAPDEKTVTSKHNQGPCNLCVVDQPPSPDEDNDTILHIRWMRSTQGNFYEVIEDNDTLVYTPTATDVGCCLRAEVIAYVNGVFSFLYFDISTPIIAGPPTCPHLEVKGKVMEGHVMMAEADYIGGIEGNSSLDWYRITPDGEEVPINISDPWAGYKLTSEDVNCCIKVEFTPMRNDWVAGEPKSVLTAPVEAGPPECESIKIIGNLIQGSELEVEVIYSGGVEGESYYQWLRKDDKSEEYYAIEEENTTRYIPTLEDVGKWLAVEYTPVNERGEEGETCRCVLEKSIEPSAPEIHNLQVVGSLVEEHVLTLEYEYTGGHFGTHLIQWFRRDRSKRLIKIGRPGSVTLPLTKRELDCTIEVLVTPVRSDGVQGRVVSAKTETAILPAAPQVKFLTVVGEPQVGNTLELEVEYFGGEPGDPIIEWACEVPETEDFETVATDVRTYVVRKEDQGKMIQLTYTPVRRDGTVGESTTRTVRVPLGSTKEERDFLNTVDGSEPVSVNLNDETSQVEQDGSGSPADVAMTEDVMISVRDEEKEGDVSIEDIADEEKN